MSSRVKPAQTGGLRASHFTPANVANVAAAVLLIGPGLIATIGTLAKLAGDLWGG